MRRRQVAGFAGLLSAVALLIGVWFWWTEHSYASDHPRNGELAATLQWVGVAIALIAGAVFVISMLVAYDDE